MAYDQGLAQRIREIIGDLPDCVEKKMFGGLCYIKGGNMACGVYKDFLIVRVGPDDYESALLEPHTRKFDITGKPMKGWVMVESIGCSEDADLIQWVRKGLVYAGFLPPK